MPSTEAFDLGPVPTRTRVSAELVRGLVAAQFPQWGGLAVAPVPNGGWDNWTFRLGTTMLVRLPSAAEYAQAVEKEHRWLPALAPRLPLPVPVPLAKGEPSAEFPHPWSIYGWLDGVTASADRIASQDEFARDLADFLAALQDIDAAGGPQPGIHNWFRGGPLRTYDEDTRRALEELAGHVDVELARDIWTHALLAPWDGVDPAHRRLPGDLPGSVVGRRGLLGTRAGLGAVEDTHHLCEHLARPRGLRGAGDRERHPRGDLRGVHDQPVRRIPWSRPCVKIAG